MGQKYILEKLSKHGRGLSGRVCHRHTQKMCFKQGFNGRSMYFEYVFWSHPKPFLSILYGTGLQGTGGIYLAVIWLLKKLYSFLSFPISVLGSFSENVLSPKGSQKNSQNCKIPKCSDLIDFQMILPISICKFDAKNIPDAFKHVPDLY